MNNLLDAIIAAKLAGGGGGGGSGLTEDVKQALMDVVNNVAWINGDGQQYIDELEAALYPLSYITAAYTQSGPVYDTDSLDSLKADLVVTAFYQGGDSKTVTDYTLSGTLAEGTSTITVSYGGKTASFDVTVSQRPALWEIENQTVPSGSPAIDSDIPLLATDIDFTVLYDITIEGSVPDTSSLLRIINNTEVGFSLRVCKYAASHTRFTFTYMGTSEQIGNNGDIGTGRHRFVITHQKGSGTAKALYRKEDGQIYEATISKPFATTQKNFVLGQTSGDAFKLPQCVLHKVAIYDSLLPESEINEFLDVTEGGE